MNILSHFSSQAWSPQASQPYAEMEICYWLKKMIETSIFTKSRLSQF